MLKFIIFDKHYEIGCKTRAQNHLYELPCPLHFEKMSFWLWVISYRFLSPEPIV